MTARRFASSSLLLASALATAGCKEEEPPPADVTRSIFEITSYTRNDAGCDAPGASVLEELQGDGYVYFYEMPLAGLQTMTCKTPDDCLEKARAFRAKERAPETRIGASYFEKIDDRRRKGVRGVKGTQNGAMCEKGSWGTTSLVVRGGEITTELREAVADLPVGESGACDAAQVKAALSDKPCMRLTTLKAKLHGPRPR